MELRVERTKARNIIKFIDQNIRKNGFEFAASFFALWKSLKLHEEENDTVVKNLEKTLNLMNVFFKTYLEISIKYNGVDISINEQRLRASGGADYLDMLSSLFLSLFIGEIKIPSNVTKEDFITFFKDIRIASPGTIGNEDVFKKNKKYFRVKKFTNKNRVLQSCIRRAAACNRKTINGKTGL